MGIFDDVPTVGQKPAPSAGGLFDDVPTVEDTSVLLTRGKAPSTATFAEESGRALLGGFGSLAQGLSELGAEAVDTAFGTNSARSVTNFFDDTLKYVRPETRAGEIGEDLVTFGLGFIPILGWLGRARMAAQAVKAGKTLKPSASRILRSADNFGKSSLGQAALSSRAGLIGTTAVATGGYEFLFSRDGRTTMSDAFEVGPLQTEPDTGLRGREESLRRIRNRLRQVPEAMALSLGLDTALTGVSAGVRAVGSTEAAGAAARGVRSGFDLLGKGLLKIPGTEAIGRTATKYLTPSAGADIRVYEELMDTVSRADAFETGGIKAYAEFDEALKNNIQPGLLKGLSGKGRAVAKRAEKDTFRFLTGLRGPLTEYGPEVEKAANRLVSFVGERTDDFVAALEREVARTPPGTKRAEKINDALKLLKDQSDAQRGFLRRQFQRYEDPVAYFKGLDPDIQNTPLYKRAVGEVVKNIYKDTPAVWGSEEALRRGQYEVNKIIGIEGINNGKTPQQALRQALEEAKNISRGGKQSLLAADMPKLKLTPSLLTPRKKLVDESPNLRELLGEVTDPKELFYKTIGDMSKTTAALNFYRNMADSGMVAALDTANKALSSGFKPLFVQAPDVVTGTTSLVGTDFGPYLQEAARRRALMTPQDPLASDLPPEIFGQDIEAQQIIEEYLKNIESQGYRKLGADTGLDDVFLGNYGAITGLYASAETYSALTAPMRIGVDGLEIVTSVLAQLKALSQKMTIVANPESFIRQTAGNLLSLGGTDNLGRETNFSDVYTAFTGSLSELDEAGLTRMAEKLSLSGVTDSSLLIKALQEYGSAGKDLSVSGTLFNLISRGEKAIPFLRVLETAYSQSDSIIKGIGVISEENKLMQAFAKSGLDPDNPPVELLREMVEQGVIKRLASKTNPELTAIEVAAADNVKDMFPVQGRLGFAVRTLDKYPIFGAFTSFASENIRNSVNTLSKGLSEMSFRVTDDVRQVVGEQVSSAFEKQIRGQGARRLTAYVAMATIIPQSAVRGAMMATGVSEEQMAATQRLAPEYTAGHDLIPTNFDKNGLVEYLTLGSVLPYAFVVDPAKAGIRAYNTAGELGKSEAEQILSGMWTAVKNYADPFASETINLEKVFDVLPKGFLGRGGETIQGAKIYRDSESAATQVLKSISHIASAFVPGYARELVELRSGDWEPGRITRAYTGESGPQGQRYTLPTEAARIFTGLTPMELNLRRDFQFFGNAYSTRRSDAKTAAQGVIKAPDKSPEEMIEAWDTYLNNLFREQVQLYRQITDARTLGLSDREIRRSLVKEAKLGSDEINMIMRGKFAPGSASEELMKDLRAKERAEGTIRTTPVSDIPFREFNRMTRDRKRQKLSGEDAAEALAPRSVAPTGGGLFDDVPLMAPSGGGLFDDVPVITPGGGGSGSRSTQGAAPPPPAFGSMPAPSAPQPPTAPASRASLSPSLLGGDLASQMANMEIARRLGG